MSTLNEPRTLPRHHARLGAIADYQPARTDGRWWESFEVRMEDVSRSGARFVSTVPVEPGGRMRLLLRPSEEARPPVTVAGRIVWVTKPAVPWMGRYQAGLAFDPPSRRVVAGLR